MSPRQVRGDIFQREAVSSAVESTSLLAGLLGDLPRLLHQHLLLRLLSVTEAASFLNPWPSPCQLHLLPAASSPLSLHSPEESGPCPGLGWGQGALGLAWSSVPQLQWLLHFPPGPLAHPFCLTSWLFAAKCPGHSHLSTNVLSSAFTVSHF